MPIVNGVVLPEFQGKTFPRYKAPHVPNQVLCTQLVATLGQAQPTIGCDPISCNNGCVPDAPSLHNPGPSFANATHSVNLVRIHKATVHYSCVRALLILQREILNDSSANAVQRHKYALARVLMRPAPGDAYKAKVDFRTNIMNGTYTRNATGVWQAWQTGTTGLRTMDLPSIGGPSADTLQFAGVTSDGMQTMPGQMQCWNASCIGLPDCWRSPC
jgi:hypothetical protein